MVYSKGTWSKSNNKETLPSTLPLTSYSSDEDQCNFDSDLDISDKSHTSLPMESDFDLDVPIAVRKGVRACTQHPISHFLSYSHLPPSYKAFFSKLLLSVPNNVHDALTIPKWKRAMIKEMNALCKNGTWELIKLPEGKRTVGYKCVYTVKHRADGSIERYKTRFAAKGFTQIYGIS